MTFLLLVLLVAAIYLLFSNRKNISKVDTENQLKQRNGDWLTFISGYKSGATKSQSEIINKMLSDAAARGLTVTKNLLDNTTPSKLQSTQSFSQPKTQQSSTLNVSHSYNDGTSIKIEPYIESPRQPIDNITLLLYFGAFLFVASVGLFVAFSNAGGALRTSAVALVTLALYASGIWIYNNRPKLKPAGLAFAGIGIAIAPLVGVAAYNYLFLNQAEFVWLTTSIMCFLLYAHALFVLKNSLISYIFIFTFLSLFESSISMFSAPIYYFGWAMAAVGILLRALSLWKGYMVELQESSRTSAQLFLPLAVLVSFVLVGSHGIGQLGISLLLAAMFYGLEAYQSTSSERENNAVIAHISLLSGIVSLAYSLSNNYLTTGIVLLLVCLVQLAIIFVISPVRVLPQNFASVSLVAAIAAIIFVFSSPVILLLAVINITISGYLIWLRQNRNDAFVLASLGLISIPLVFGQMVIEPALVIESQTMLLGTAMLVNLSIFILSLNSKHNQEWLESGRSMYLIAVVSVIIAGLLASPVFGLAITIGSLVTVYILAKVDERKSWSIVGGVLVLAPLITKALAQQN